MTYLAIAILGIFALWGVKHEITSFFINQYEPVEFWEGTGIKWWIVLITVFAISLIDPPGLRWTISLIILAIITTNKAVLDILTYQKTKDKAIISQLLRVLMILIPSMALCVLLIMWSKY